MQKISEARYKVQPIRAWLLRMEMKMRQKCRKRDRRRGRGRIVTLGKERVGMRRRRLWVTASPRRRAC